MFSSHGKPIDQLYDCKKRASVFYLHRSEAVTATLTYVVTANPGVIYIADWNIIVICQRIRGTGVLKVDGAICGSIAADNVTLLLSLLKCSGVTNCEFDTVVFLSLESDSGAVCGVSCFNILPSAALNIWS